MDSKAVFTQESNREAFMGLCVNVLPLIDKIIGSAKEGGVDGMVGITVDTNGYVSFDVHNSRWKMGRLDSGSPAKIEYQYSEVLDIPEEGPVSKVQENIIEIAWAFETMAQGDSTLGSVSTEEWKRRFVEWAEEFERSHEDTGTYLDDIYEYATEKISQYALGRQGEADG